MEVLGLNTLRERFLTFFEGKGHLRQESFPLVPQGDNSLLLINSGMAPLKPYFSGEATPPSKRMTTCQKCIRTPDIERVGKTSRHGTFFEMLGNFSFGDYFKREACAWAWEFVTREMKIPKDKLHVTVYLDDDEAAEIWEKEIGVEKSHISRLGKADNFWEIGSGPCGPCSEIYFDRGEKYGCGSPDCKVGCDCDRYVEIWNLVFTQYHNDGQGNYTELKHKNIDTGMGLERLACIVQDVDSLFDVDTVMNITKHVSGITGVSYGQSDKADISLRVITDHIRSTTMLICDGVLPSNEGRGYVLRRLLRRAARHGKLLGVSRPFLYEVCQTVIDESKSAYPDLEEKREYITKVIRNEEENFNKTIDSGLKILEAMLSDMARRGEKVMSGEDGFKLYDTYGFPVDLTLELLEEKGLDLDRESFDQLMSRQRERARAATSALGDFGWAGVELGLDKDTATVFTGYTQFTDMAQVLAIVVDNEPRSGAYPGDKAVVVLDKTPFYAESGGQVSDIGTLSAQGARFEVRDVHKSKDDKYMHSGVLKEGNLRVGDTVRASIDEERRRAVMRAHSCTHLLHKALRGVLGTHVEQAGSLVTPDAIRFDFTHFSAIAPQELERIDDQVNEAILSGLSVTATETSQEEARKMGALALFGEKYGDTVRVIQMGDYSTELCGGTHLDNTAKIGSYQTQGEFSVASGVRRIEALVGKGVLRELRDKAKMVNKIAGLVKSTPLELEAKVEGLLLEMRENKKTIQALTTKNVLAQAETLLEGGQRCDDVRIITAVMPGATPEELRTVGDYLRDKDAGTAAVLAAVRDNKITFLSVCGKEAVSRGIKAGDLIKKAAAATGGSGGGKPDSAMGGGKNIDALDGALKDVSDYIRETI